MNTGLLDLDLVSVSYVIRVISVLLKTAKKELDKYYGGVYFVNVLLLFAYEKKQASLTSEKCCASRYSPCYNRYAGSNKQSVI